MSNSSQGPTQFQGQKILFGQQIKSPCFLQKSYIFKGNYIQLTNVFTLDQVQIAASTDVIRRTLNALFVWLISHQPAVLFSQNKPATSHQSRWQWVPETRVPDGFYPIRRRVWNEFSTRGYIIGQNLVPVGYGGYGCGCILPIPAYPRV